MNERYQNLESKLVSQNSGTKVWQIYDKASKSDRQFVVSQTGELHFKIYKSTGQEFPYSKALEMLVELEKRKLMIIVSNSNSKYEKIIEKAKCSGKVPCSGVSFQMYYLNP